MMAGRGRWPWSRKVEDDRPDAEMPVPMVVAQTTEVVGDQEVHTTTYDVGLTVSISHPVREERRSVTWDWPRSAPDPTGPATPPPGALAAAPGLDRVLSELPDPQLPSAGRHDWPVTATLAELNFGTEDWNDQDTAHVRAAIADDVDAFMRSLIDRWRGLWWQQTWESKFQARFPAFVASLEHRHRTDPRFARKREAHRTKWLESACTIGLWDVYRERHPWPDYEAQNCVVCGRRFAPEGLWASELSFGPPIACKACCRRAMFGHQLATVDVPNLLVRLADRMGAPPPSGFRDKRDFVALSADRAELMALLVALPDATTCGDVLGAPSGSGRWLTVLQRSGIVGEAVKMPRGIWSRASDGHLCRSFGELAVENYLIAQGVPHECEPVYPAHPELNPGGRQRADWLLPGGRWVEYAGMMDAAEYASKMTVKVQLAAACGIELLVLTPDDLPRLAEVIGVPKPG